jgi:type I restriction enzyme, R subunit
MNYEELTTMMPEEKARQEIDQLLRTAGWQVQDYNDLNLGASIGVVVREFPLRSGFADYLLFIDREAIGAIEAKAEGTTLSGVEDQTWGYLSGLPEEIPHTHNPLPFGYESTVAYPFFVNLRNPESYICLLGNNPKEGFSFRSVLAKSDILDAF